MLYVNRILHFIVHITVLLSCAACVEQEGLRIYITGDVMLDRAIRKQIERSGFHYVFEGVKDSFAKADAVVINLECPLSATNNQQRKSYTFKGDPSWADSLKTVGVTHACLANNHTYDQGAQGLKETIELLGEAKIQTFGAGKTIEERLTPVLIGTRNNQLALYSVSFLSTGYFTNAEGKPGICNTSATLLGEHIVLFKKKHPKTKVVVIPHWGIEYKLTASDLQKKQADTLTKAGANLIIGHHPHVVQNTDTLNGAIVYYSLGNFIFDQKEDSVPKSALLEIELKNGQLTSRQVPLHIANFRPYYSE